MNVPNALSLMRLCMAPVFVLVLFSAGEYAHLWAALVYLLACATDILDGYIARHYNKITKLGRIIDPLADKLLSLTVLFCVTIIGLIPWWALAVLLGKETLMGLGALVQYRRRADIQPAAWPGKTATVVFFVVAFLLLIFKNQIESGLISSWLPAVAISFAIAANLVALVYYAILFFRRDSGKGE